MLYKTLILLGLSLSLFAENKYNVLFICVDDLRNELGCYGVPEIKTPNFDKLANQSIVFENHYVQVPTCGASRYALLTGQRPINKRSLNNGAFNQLSHLSSEKSAQSLPELFRRSGYKTSTIGKVSHSPDGKLFKYTGEGKGLDELPNAWDINNTPYGKWKYGWGCFFAYDKGKHREDKSGYKPRYEFPEIEDNELPDGMNCEAALAQLEELKDERFFMALGFYKPHLPFVAPKKYRDLYNDIDLKIAQNQSRGETKHWHGSGEFYKYQTHTKQAKPLSEAHQIEAKKAYYACVSYIDAQLGKVLNKLKELGLDQNTIIVLWGDHGWNLGDHQIWGKHTPLETALKSPLFISIPGEDHQRSNAIVETVDIYPTLMDLCEVKYKKTKSKLSGTSLVPQFNNKGRGKDFAISYWKDSISIRNKRYRLITKIKGTTFSEFELYDHDTDPNETTNIAPTSKAVIENLTTIIKRENTYVY